MTSWATPAEASVITNKAVSQNELNSAQTVVEIYSNVTVEASGSMSTKDIRWLKRAVAWQAVWQGARTDFGAGMDVDQVTQDGQTFMKGYADAHILAPLARKCLSRLTWNKSRTLDPLSPDEAASLHYGARGVSGSEEWLDDFQRWEPM